MILASYRQIKESANLGTTHGESELRRGKCHFVRGDNEFALGQAVFEALCGI